MDNAERAARRMLEIGDSNAIDRLKRTEDVIRLTVEKIESAIWKAQCARSGNAVPTNTGMRAELTPNEVLAAIQLDLDNALAHLLGEHDDAK